MRNDISPLNSKIVQIESLFFAFARQSTYEVL